LLRSKPFTIGRLSGSVYDFEIAGDMLPMHEHDEVSNHVTVVARGSFRVRGSGWEQTLFAGDFIDFEPHDPHEFVAIEDRSRLVNFRKG